MSQFIAVLIFAPPVLACAVWILGRAWSLLVFGGAIPEGTRRWQRRVFWPLLAAMYLVIAATGIVQHKF